MHNLAPAVTRLVETLHPPGLVATRFGRDGLDTFAAGQVEADARFPLASVTKTFTADLTLRAAEAERLDPDAPIRTRLPDFRLADPAAADRLTFRDALCHFSGLPPHTWAWVYGDLDRAEWIATRLPHLAGEGPHRQRHRYCNILYAVLGEALRRVEGSSWEALMAERVVRQLALDSIEPLTADWAETSPPPHRMTPRGPERIPPFVARESHPLAPASELRGTIPDLARWGRYLLEERGRGDAWRAHNRVADARPHPAMGSLSYGLGWRLDRIDGARRVWHSGQCGGYSVLLCLYPERACGLAAATNVSGAVDMLHALDLQLHHGVDHAWAGIHMASEGAETRRPVKQGAPAPGVYDNPGYGRLQIETRDGEAWSRFQTSRWARMTRTGDGVPRIHLEEYDASFPVRLDGHGALSIPFEPRVAPIVFRNSISGSSLLVEG